MARAVANVSFRRSSLGNVRRLCTHPPSSVGQRVQKLGKQGHAEGLARVVARDSKLMGQAAGLTEGPLVARWMTRMGVLTTFAPLVPFFPSRFDSNMNKVVAPLFEDDNVASKIVGAVVTVLLLPIFVSVALAMTAAETAVVALPIFAAHGVLFHSSWEIQWSRAMKYLGAASFVAIPVCVAWPGVASDPLILRRRLEQFITDLRAPAAKKSPPVEDELEDEIVQKQLRR